MESELDRILKNIEDNPEVEIIHREETLEKDFGQMSLIITPKKGIYSLSKLRKMEEAIYPSSEKREGIVLGDFQNFKKSWIHNYKGLTLGYRMLMDQIGEVIETKSTEDVIKFNNLAYAKQYSKKYGYTEKDFIITKRYSREDRGIFYRNTHIYIFPDKESLKIISPIPFDKTFFRKLRDCKIIPLKDLPKIRR